MKIISGGQTGVDRAALDAAIELGFEYGGSLPKGRLAEDGTVDVRKYPHLIELDTADYHARTKQNVADADATLAFTAGALTGGTRMTLGLAKEYGKPHLLIDLTTRSSEEGVKKIIEWLGEITPRSLNVAGPRESGAPGVYAKAYAVLKRALSQAAVKVGRRL